MHAMNKAIGATFVLAVALLLVLLATRSGTNASGDNGEQNRPLPTETPNQDARSNRLVNSLPSARAVADQQREEAARFERFTELPPEEQLVKITELQIGGELDTALVDFAKRLEESNPAEADQIIQRFWKRSTTLNSRASKFITALTDIRFNKDRESAITWADALPAEARSIAYRAIASQWTNEDSVGATEWALGIPDQALRSHIVDTIGTGLQDSKDIRGGGQWAANLAQFDVAPQHAGLIGNLWGRSDPEAAFNWSSSLEDPGPKGEAFAGLAQALADQNPEVAKEWIKAFPEEYGIQENAGLSAFYGQPFEYPEEVDVYINESSQTETTEIEK